ncbi:hypothetical protein Anapl_18439 [Anas platyrhynchos]|uniref:Uncharacterized protein n=1 Tax=Anas platyrhynchos TaxID=8839 RepID=R0KV17_ANAPL|nr:hypothetical protein Anapl_18439 [Anas platyrhynchos]
MAGPNQEHLLIKNSVCCGAEGVTRIVTKSLKTPELGHVLLLYKNNPVFKGKTMHLNWFPGVTVKSSEPRKTFELIYEHQNSHTTPTDAEGAAGVSSFVPLPPELLILHWFHDLQNNSGSYSLYQELFAPIWSSEARDCHRYITRLLREVKPDKRRDLSTCLIFARHTIPPALECIEKFMYLAVSQDLASGKGIFQLEAKAIKASSQPQTSR